MPAHALVADDDPDARSALAALLAADGFDVTTASDGGLAAAAVLAPGMPAFAVAVVDCEMPVLGGPGFLARIRAAGQRVPVLLLGGTTDPAAVAGPAADPLAAFLAKPFTPDDLRRAVAALIAAAGGTP